MSDTRHPFVTGAVALLATAGLATGLLETAYAQYDCQRDPKDELREKIGEIDVVADQHDLGSTFMKWTRLWADRKTAKRKSDALDKCAKDPGTFQVKWATCSARLKSFYDQRKGDGLATDTHRMGLTKSDSDYFAELTQLQLTFPDDIKNAAGFWKKLALASFTDLESVKAATQAAPPGWKAVAFLGHIESVDKLNDRSLFDKPYNPDAGRATVGRILLYKLVNDHHTFINFTVNTGVAQPANQPRLQVSAIWTKQGGTASTPSTSWPFDFKYKVEENGSVTLARNDVIPAANALRCAECHTTGLIALHPRGDVPEQHPPPGPAPIDELEQDDYSKNLAEYNALLTTIPKINDLYASDIAAINQVIKQNPSRIAYGQPPPWAADNIFLENPDQTNVETCIDADTNLKAELKPKLKTARCNACHGAGKSRGSLHYESGNSLSILSEEIMFMPPSLAGHLENAWPVPAIPQPVEGKDDENLQAQQQHAQALRTRAEGIRHAHLALATCLVQDYGRRVKGWLLQQCN